MNRDPVPTEEKIIQSSVLKKFSPKCIPSVALKVLRLKTPQIQKNKNKRPFNCKVIQPIGREMILKKTTKNKASTLLDGFQLYASCGRLNFEAGIAKYLQLHLQNTEIAKKFLVNYLEMNMRVVPLVLFGALPNAETPTPISEISQSLVKLQRENDQLKARLCNLKTQNKLSCSYNAGKGQNQSIGASDDCVESELPAELKKLKNNPFVNSMHIICTRSRTGKISVRLFINEIYEFIGTMNHGFESALAVSIEKSKSLADENSSHYRDDVIPWTLRNDVRLLIALFELKTGLSIDDVNIKYEKCDSAKKWKATALINDVEYSSGGLAEEQFNVFKNLLLTFLEENQMAFLEMSE